MRLYFILDSVKSMFHAHLTVFNYLIQFNDEINKELMNITLIQSIVLGDQNRFILDYKKSAMFSLKRLKLYSQK